MVEWVEGDYGTHRLTLAKGMIVATASWDGIHGGGYRFSVNRARSKQHYKTLEEAKAEAEAVVRDMLRLAVAQMGMVTF